MDKYYTVDEIALILDLDGNTVRRYFREKRFPKAFKIGSSWRLSEADLKKWIDAKKG